VESPAIPSDESDRLVALHRTALLDTPEEERFDRIVRLAQHRFQVPMSWISLVAEDRQWLKSSCGLSFTETPRNVSFCGHTILNDKPLVIPDALADPRFQDNPMVINEPGIRFYAGHPIRSVSGHRLGSFCIADQLPRTLDEPYSLALRDLARFVEDQIQMTDMVSLQETLIASRRETKEAHDFIRQAFGRFVAEDVADSILKSPESLNLGGAKRRVTVMFSDLRGFTRLSETLPPEDVVGLLNRYFTAMVDIIIKYGGTIDSFIGDAILVVFGAPRDGSENAASALACAVEMQLGLDELNDEFEDEGIPALAMGIGVNTGDVVAGNIGSPKRMSYSVIGETVNLAARIESMTLGRQILASAETMAEVGTDARVDGQLRVKLKGVSTPTFIYDVTGIGGNFDVYLENRSGSSTIEFFLPVDPDALD